jgi:hypothetical protein
VEAYCQAAGWRVVGVYVAEASAGPPSADAHRLAAQLADAVRDRTGNGILLTVRLIARPQPVWHR